MRALGPIAALVIVTSFVAFCGTAQASSSQANARYEEGRAFAKRSDWENARQSFAQAVLLEPNDMRYLWNLALSESKTHHEVEALRHFRYYGHHPQVPHEDKREALHYIAELERHTGRISIDAPKLVEIRVDDEAFGLTPIDAVDVAPGVHTVSGKDTRGVSRKVVVRATEATFVVAKLDFGAEVAAAPVAVLPEPHRALGHDSPSAAKKSGPPVLTYILAGTALASAAVGSIFLTNAYSAADDAKTIRRTNPAGFCNDRNASACKSLIDANDSASTRGAVSTVLFVTAGVTLAGAVAAWLAWPAQSGHEGRREGAAWVAPAVGDGHVGVVAGGTF